MNYGINIRKRRSACTLCIVRDFVQKKMSELFLVTSKEVIRFVTECMVAVGAAAKHGEILADTLLVADRRGHYSHGLNRLGS